MVSRRGRRDRVSSDWFPAELAQDDAIMAYGPPGHDKAPHLLPEPREVDLYQTLIERTRTRRRGLHTATGWLD